jgi:hypothetical protein
LGNELPATYLPEHVLVYSTSLVAWWEPARRRTMFFSAESDGKTLDGKVSRTCAFLTGAGTTRFSPRPYESHIASPRRTCSAPSETTRCSGKT